MGKTDVTLRLMLLLVLLCSMAGLLQAGSNKGNCAQNDGQNRQRVLRLTLMNIEVLGLSVCESTTLPAGRAQ
jgi:hypothetical protein